MRRDDLWSAAVLTVFGVSATLEALKLTVGKPGSPGPGLFPFLLALGLSLTSLALLISAFRAAGRKEPGATGPQEFLRWGKVTWTLFGLFIYAFALEGLGFIPATFLLMLFLFRIVEPLSWTAAIGGSLATSLVSYLLFNSWLQVRLPPIPWAP